MSEAPFRVVVLTCADLGLETGEYLAGLPGITVAGVVIAPYPRLPLKRRIRRVIRNWGMAGTARLLARKLLRKLRGSGGRRNGAARNQPGESPTVPLYRLDDFHDENGLALLRRLAPDLAVIDGTYILKESVFSLPRHGSINLHCGKLPEFRGMPPAFWELYHGVNSVGVTIHRVAASLDAGPILAEAAFPLELAPPEDPLQYVEQYWRSVLRPNGIRLLGEVVQRIANGTVQERPQPPHDSPPNRTPTRRQVRELEARIRARRSMDSGKGSGTEAASGTD